jgi:hypothetical protein
MPWIRALVRTISDRPKPRALLINIPHGILPSKIEFAQRQNFPDPTPTPLNEYQAYDLYGTGGAVLRRCY